VITRRQLVTASVAGLTLAGCGADGDQRLLAADTQTNDHPAVIALRYFAKRLDELSGGALRVNVYPSGQLGGQAEALELAQFGGIDIVRVNLAPLNVFAPLTIVPVLPFVFRSIDHMRAAMDGAPGRQILDSLHDHQLVGLGFYESGARSFYTTSRLIHEPADLKGLKIRVQTSDIFVQMVEALGGDATPMSYGEVYQAMMQGVIDGAENNWPSYLSSRHFEVAPYFSQTGHVMAPEVLAVSVRRWKKLSSDERMHMQQAANESVVYMRSLWDQAVVDAQKSLRAADVKVTTDVDHAAFVGLMADLWARYRKDPVMDRLVADIQSVQGEPA